ncbi:MAG: HEAT repeat domain-containing protein [Verrucomicrobiota bacterium]
MILLGFAWVVRPSGEPTSDGRTLTQWMAKLGSADGDENAHAFAAIERIGTNGVPFILPRLGARDSALQFQLLALVQRAPFLDLRFSTPSERRQKATVALILAGEEAMRKSMPDLIRLSRDKDSGVRLTAVELLSTFPFNDSDPLPALRAAQADPDARVRATAQQTAGSRNAVGQEVQRLRDLRPNQPHGANSRHGGPGQFDRVGMAAVAHAERWPSLRT